MANRIYVGVFTFLEIACDEFRAPVLHRPHAPCHHPVDTTPKGAPFTGASKRRTRECCSRKRQAGSLARGSDALRRRLWCWEKRRTTTNDDQVNAKTETKSRTHAMDICMRDNQIFYTPKELLRIAPTTPWLGRVSTREENEASEKRV